MSLQRYLLNGWLRRVEKPRMVRAQTPEPLRRALEFQAKLLFHAPRGTTQRWTKLAHLPALEIVPKYVAAEPLTILYFHGGGFTFGSPRTHAAMVAQLAYRLGARAILPQYRLAPEAPFPAAPDDALTAWNALVAAGTAPRDIVIGGDSAGGALAFGLLADLCAKGAALPGVVFGFSPLTDMTHSGESFQKNADCDVVLPAKRADRMGQMFLMQHPPEDPRVSPVFGKFEGAPPIWITVGDTEILHDDALSLAQVCQRDGVEVTLVEQHDLPHVWPIFHNILPEAKESLDSLAAWIRQQRDRPGES
ncbi:alpha/beta hydrolase fold domain-containing protein [Sulfitobacter sp. SK011]|uniref:alpha/beta hydrolase fold domain-containing protein n=1 Tax=Sulfitobacter sp. SK011 TaxID=1389004 RepID=UPI000E0B1709|nr:alpha/beta hydrolase [Sulfitobacter sp. SK011]AXI43494.1 esterase [Sulfitobacter sp. SK011]